MFGFSQRRQIKNVCLLPPLPLLCIEIERFDCGTCVPTQFIILTHVIAVTQVLCAPCDLHVIVLIL